MDPKVVDVITKHFEIADTFGVKIATCRGCRKQVVLRSGSLAVTRLLSHVINSHGSLEQTPPLKAVKP